MGRTEFGPQRQQDERHDEDGPGAHRILQRQPSRAAPPLRNHHAAAEGPQRAQPTGELVHAAGSVGRPSHGMTTPVLRTALRSKCTPARSATASYTWISSNDRETSINRINAKSLPSM